LAIGEYAPYYSKKLPGYGVVPRMVTAAFAIEGVAVEYDWYPWARAYNYVQKGRWDGSFTGARTPEREKHFYYSEPVRKNEVVFFHLRSYPFDWLSFDDLTGSPIGGTIGYDYSRAFSAAEKEGKITVERVPDDIMNFRKLLTGRIRIFPISKEVGNFKLNEHFQPDQIRLLTTHPKPVTVNTVHLILSKKIKRNKRMLRLFNQGLKRLKQNRQYDP
jgi:polar amino acid transport system substrate-binding protein